MKKVLLIRTLTPLAPQDDGYSQQDAQETYSAIFNRVSEGDDEFSQAFEIHIEYIDTISDDHRREAGELLGSHEKLVSSIKRNTEITTMLSLDIENSDLTDLKTCFARFFKEEDCEMNYWQTTTGKEIDLVNLFGYPIPAKRIKKIVKMPKILAVHLNRFRNKGAQLTKLDNNIAFPLEFDANYYINADHMPVYDLRGTIFHSAPPGIAGQGTTIHAGHYWAFVKNLQTKEYYLYNDHKKESASSDMIAIGNFGKNKQALGDTAIAIEATAYMLFYEVK